VECSAGRLARAFLGGNFEKPHSPRILDGATAYFR